MKISQLATLLMLTLGLGLGVAATVAASMRVNISNNWEARRCDPGVMAIASFFKPANDPRTPSQFATDNWSFCQKEYVQEGIRAAAAIPQELAQAEGAVVGVVRDIAGSLADVFFDVWKVCHEAYSTFMDRMKVVAKLAHNFMIQLHSIVGRLQASALSIVFGLISLIAAYISATQLVLIVAIAIIGILIALQIILFFVLLPISGLIISVTAIISVTVVAVATAIAAATVAELFTPGACFAAGTRIMMGRGRGAVPIENMRIGDTLLDGGVVTAVHRFRQREQFYDVDGILVTGDHLIQMPNRPSRMARVRDVAIAPPLPAAESDLWCLTTTTRRIPIQGRERAHVFADWEEIPEADTMAQMAWYNSVWQTLNPSEPPEAARKCELAAEAGVSPDCQIPMAGWFGQRQLRRAMDVRIGDWLYTREGLLTRVVGVVELAGDQVTDAVELRGAYGEPALVSVGSWVRGLGWPAWRHPSKEPARDLHPVRWRHFYTTAGEFQVGAAGSWSIRDASDVGLAKIGDLVDDVVLVAEVDEPAHV